MSEKMSRYNAVLESLQGKIIQEFQEQKKLRYKDKRMDYKRYQKHSKTVEKRYQLIKTKKSYRYYLEKTRPYILANFQKEIVAVLENFRILLKLIVMPREHGKSTLGCEEFLCWYGNNNPFHYAIIFSETADQATKRGLNIRDIVETTPELMHLKQPNKENWGTESFKFRNGFYVEMKGAGAGVAGSKYLDRRPDVIILDDVVPSTTGKISDATIDNWYKETIVCLGGPDTIIIIIGTPYRDRDLIASLRTNDKIHQLHYEALLGKDIEALYDPTTEVLWPEHWPLSRLREQFEAKLEGNRMVFARQYLCRVVSEGSKLYPLHMIQRCMDPTLTFQLSNKEALYRYQARVMGCDLASSDEVGADYFVCMVYGITDTGRFHYMWSERHKGLRPDQARALVWYLQNTFELDLTVIETNGFQRVFAADIEMGNVFPVLRHNTSQNKQNDLVGLPTVKTHLTNGRIVYPTALCNYRQCKFEDTKDERGNIIVSVIQNPADETVPYQESNLQVLFDEMAGWQWDSNKAKWVTTNRHDDTVLAQWFVCLAAVKFGSFIFSYAGSMEIVPKDNGLEGVNAALSRYFSQPDQAVSDPSGEHIHPAPQSDVLTVGQQTYDPDTLFRSPDGKDPKKSSLYDLFGVE